MTHTIELHQAGKLDSLPPLSLYVHIPWCVEKCPYCDFNSHKATHTLPEEAYINALLIDLENELPRIWGRKIHSIFIGGGTPGLFQAASINQLLQGIRARVSLIPDAEITLETNPGVFEQNRFQGFAQAGINRLSIGVQSFQDDKLRYLGRIHTAQEAHQAIERAQKIFPHINLDIMYALPTQTQQQAQQDIQAAIAHGSEHISAYQLTLEPNTAFAHNPPAHLPNDEQLADIEEAVHQTLHQHHFERYEISAFCRQKKYCRHNLNYWQFGDYLGIGAGAHGKISYAHSIERNSKIRHPQHYLKAIEQHRQADANRHTIKTEDLTFEFMMNALRLIQGVPIELFTQRTGIPLHHIRPTLQQASQQKLLKPDLHTISASELGIRFLNNLLTLF